MRPLFIAPFLTAALLSTSLVHAGMPCSATYALNDEDISIMASVLPQAQPETANTQVAEETVHVLLSMADPYGRLGQDDLAQIQSVQPAGKKVIYCLNQIAHRP